MMRNGPVMMALAAGLTLNACAIPSSRIADYLSGFPTTPASSRPAQQAAGPIVAGLVLALPETEMGKPTTPSPAMLEKVAGRIQKELQESSAIVIRRIWPPITIPGSGLAGLSLERIRELAGEENPATVLVVVATSWSATKMRFWPIQENQLYVRMDAALVDVPAGLVLLTESGQQDYVMADNLDYVDRISFPRLYYRDFTVGGPFTIVKKEDPYQALAWETFGRAADQLGMKLRQRVSPAAAP